MIMTRASLLISCYSFTSKAHEIEISLYTHVRKLRGRFLQNKTNNAVQNNPECTTEKLIFKFLGGGGVSSPGPSTQTFMSGPTENNFDITQMMGITQWQMTI